MQRKQTALIEVEIHVPAYTIQNVMLLTSSSFHNEFIPVFNPNENLILEPEISLLHHSGIM